jgi:hypothetical protein
MKRKKIIIAPTTTLRTALLYMSEEANRLKRPCVTRFNSVELVVPPGSSLGHLGNVEAYYWWSTQWSAKA